MSIHSTGSVQVGIDASRALRARRTGTERYSLEIIRHLLALPEAAEHSFRLYVQDEPPVTDGQPFWGDPRFDVRVLSARYLWTHTALAWEVTHHRPDVLFVPSHVIPFVSPRFLPPTVVTLHDVGYRHFPAAHTATQRLYLDLSTRWSSYAAVQIITPSQATADDLTTFYGTIPEKIRVIDEAANPFPQTEFVTAKPPHPSPPHSGEGTGSAPPPEWGRLGGGRQLPEFLQETQFVIERPYALYVGTVQPRKNLARLIEAYGLLVEANEIGWDLVIAGGQGWQSDQFQAQVAEAELSERVHFPGYVADESLPALFRGALFFAFPSLFEGFGLPVLEAQQMGVAVMTSNNSSLPEVAGDAALLVDPDDVDAIADAMLRLSRDESLRQELIAKGYENVKRFSWEKAARETLAVLVKAAGKK